MNIVIGSTSPAKLKAAQITLDKLFPKVKVKSVKVDSGVGDQPTSDKESIKGAINRAKWAQKKANADFGIGMEGGMNKIGKLWFECGWIAVVDKNGKVGLGSSGRFEVSGKIIKEIIKGKELNEAVDTIAGKTVVDPKKGFMSIVTKRNLSRPVAYSHGLIFAFAPFLSDPKFWD